MFKVLVVDDDPMVCNALSFLLEDEGYGVLTASNGREALQAARAGQPDVILLDIEMPIMTGTDALAQLKNDPATAGIPVLIITARNAESDAAGTVRLGASYYIQKPWKPGEVETSVGWALRIAGKVPPEPHQRPAHR
jgi:CheY-like chemotaxis protein